MSMFIKLKEYRGAKLFNVAVEHIVHISEEPNLAAHVHLLNGQNITVEQSAEEIMGLIRQEHTRMEAQAAKMRQALKEIGAT